MPKVGIAMDASIPMMAMATIASTSENPACDGKILEGTCTSQYYRKRIEVEGDVS
jgi:hypothetical protein